MPRHLPRHTRPARNFLESIFLALFGLILLRQLVHEALPTHMLASLYMLQLSPPIPQSAENKLRLCVSHPRFWQSCSDRLISFKKQSKLYP